MVRADHATLQQISEELTNLWSEMLKLESAILSEPLQLHDAHRGSARNLAHYLALRRHDIRQVQTKLASLGLSSLGRTEGHVMGGIRAVLTILNLLGAEETALSPSAEPVIEFGEDRILLERNTEALLGPCPKGRKVRIMVTMSTEAATDYDLVRNLLAGGMDCMRINCAHDNEAIWAGMIGNLQKAREETGRPCRILMDVAGPKLRTGRIEPGLAVVKCHPKRDEVGRVVDPARIWLVPAESTDAAPASAELLLPVPVSLLKRLRRGDEIKFRDARGAHRTLNVAAVEANRCLATTTQTAYFVPGLALRVKPRTKKSRSCPFRARLGALPRIGQTLLLKPGDTLILTRSAALGMSAQYNKKGRLVSPARIGVNLPEFFEHAKVGEPIWFDDGKIGGVIRSLDEAAITVEITQARPKGEKLGAEKGINLPETKLQVSALTPEDLKTLEFIVRHADLVGYSFVRTEKDVRQLQARLSELGGESLGMILKIETREAFENLPRLIFAAMRMRAVGIMIARGDLAVECGYQRLAEVQEEMLWIAEAAHMPVIWATQVLESLAKKGMPSRSEITDAAVGERAECVMLNKGPYAVRAVEILDDILRRMQAHQEKKSAMLRQLRLATSFAATG
jgi:pyruvate kinase